MAIDWLGVLLSIGVVAVFGPFVVVMWIAAWTMAKDFLRDEDIWP